MIYKSIDEESRVIYPTGPQIYSTQVPKELLHDLRTVGDSLLENPNTYDRNLASNFDKGTTRGYPQEFIEHVEPWLLGNVDKWNQYLLEMHHREALPSNHLRLNSLWINYQKEGDFNPIHMHPNAFLSFVIYVDADEKLFEQSDTSFGVAGHIQFVNGEFICDTYADTNWNHQPKTGEMFMFPAKLQHVVYPHFVEGYRIGVSGNIVIK